MSYNTKEKKSNMKKTAEHFFVLRQQFFSSMFLEPDLQKNWCIFFVFLRLYTND